MATYTVVGHPLNYTDLISADADLDVIRGQLATHGVGTTVTITVAAGSDTKVKGHGSLK